MRTLAGERKDRNIERVCGVLRENYVFGRIGVEKIAECNSAIVYFFSCCEREFMRSPPRISAVFAHTARHFLYNLGRLGKGCGGVIKVDHMLLLYYLTLGNGVVRKCHSHTVDLALIEGNAPRASAPRARRIDFDDLGGNIFAFKHTHSLLRQRESGEYRNISHLLRLAFSFEDFCLLLSLYGEGCRGDTKNAPRFRGALDFIWF
jgi:hypothetical protein